MKKVIVLAALTALVGAAQAQIFNNAAAFQTAINNDPGQFNNSFGAATATWSGGSPTMAYTVSAPGSSLYTDGDFLGVFNATANLVITFNSGNVRAVGGNFFHTNSVDAFIAGRAVTLTYSDGTVDTFAPTSITDFRGYVSNTILTSLTITAGGAAAPAAFASMDNVITSTQAVPEPGSILALGLGAVALMRRRKA